MPGETHQLSIHRLAQNYSSRTPRQPSQSTTCLKPNTKYWVNDGPELLVQCITTICLSWTARSLSCLRSANVIFFWSLSSLHASFRVAFSFPDSVPYYHAFALPIFFENLPFPFLSVGFFSSWFLPQNSAVVTETRMVLQQVTCSGDKESLMSPVRCLFTIIRYMLTSVLYQV
jgi:hypothetical protein